MSAFGAQDRRRRNGQRPRANAAGDVVAAASGTNPTWDTAFTAPTYSNGNRTASSDSSAYGGTKSVTSHSSGDWSFECSMTRTADDTNTAIGIIRPGPDPSSIGNAGSVCYTAAGTLYDGSGSAVGTGPAFGVGDKILVRYNNNVVTFSKNGVQVVQFSVTAGDYKALGTPRPSGQLTLSLPGYQIAAGSSYWS